MLLVLLKYITCILTLITKYLLPVLTTKTSSEWKLGSKTGNEKLNHDLQSNLFWIVEHL